MATFSALWVIGWMVTTGMLWSSKNFLAEALWWRLLQTVMFISNWPFMFGRTIYCALAPSDAAQDEKG